MKNYIDFSMDVVSKGIQKNLIQQEYKENIVFRWLKRPCLLFKQEQIFLSQESLFYICFQLLDHIKQYEDLADCQLQTDIQCIPFEVEHLFDEDNYQEPLGEHHCTIDRLLVILTLHTLLRMLGGPEADELAKCLIPDMNYTMPHNFINQNSKIYLSLQRGIQLALTEESPIYKHSIKMMQNSDYYCQTDKMHLIEFIQTYFESDRLISNEIAAQLAKKSPVEDAFILPAHDDQTEIEQLQAHIKTLEESLQQKDKEIAELRYQQETLQLPTEDCVHIKSKYKSRVAAILSAMYYADYFQGEGNLTDKNTTITHILKYGFHYPAKSVSQLLSQYVYNGGNLDMLKTDLQKTIKKQLDDALADLTNIQQDRSKERK